VAKFYFYLYIYWYTGQIYQGCGFPAVNENFQWDWAYNETQISYDVNPSFNWNVDTLNTSLLRISKDIPDPGSPNIILHYVRKYVHG
ncbi:MAG TPA: hypothetical protein VLJ68_06390, partial [Chitinophagaceae bacterium]|nr:hypothetical protein [Chitinophagaceae bacterium]